MNLQLFYLYNGKNCIKWQGILKHLWQSKQGSLSLTSLYCWACTVLMHLSLSKSSQQNKKTPFIKILAAYCCCYNCLSHAMTLWSSGTDEWGHQSQLPLKREGFDSLHLFSVLYWTQTLNPHAFTSQANANSYFPSFLANSYFPNSKDHVSSQVPLLSVEALKASLSSKRGFALSHEIISMFRLRPWSPRALAQTPQALLLNSHAAHGLNNKQ